MREAVCEAAGCEPAVCEASVCEAATHGAGAMSTESSSKQQQHTTRWSTYVSSRIWLFCAHQTRTCRWVQPPGLRGSSTPRIDLRGMRLRPGCCRSCKQQTLTAACRAQCPTKYVTTKQTGAVTHQVPHNQTDRRRGPGRQTGAVVPGPSGVPLRVELGPSHVHANGSGAPRPVES